MLTNPHPKSHIVYPYDDDAQVAGAITLFTAAGLCNGEAVVLIMADAQRDRIEALLAADGFDVKQLEKDGKLVIIEAGQMLCELLEFGGPDPAKFKTAVGNLISAARSRVGSRRVRLYGEMVNLLCGQCNLDAAARLEQLWNEAIELHSVPLLCSYSNHLLEPHARTPLPGQLMDAHTHIGA